MITVNQLKAHIAEVNRVGLTFDPNMDLRADLVRFHGFSIEDAAKMPEDELYYTIDKIQEIEEGDQYHRLIPINCECGHKGLLETDYSDWNDCYTLTCQKCRKETHMHYTQYDCMMEYLEEME